MLARRIIPCLDIKDGRVVKGVNFVNLRDAGDPVDNARYYEETGADELCFLDITASSDRRDIVRQLVERVADEIFIPFTVGGGLRSAADVRSVLLAGADKASLNTAAFENPAVLTESADLFGSQCIVCAIDARRSPAAGMSPSGAASRPPSVGAEQPAPEMQGEPPRFEVFLHGGRTPTGRDAIEWAQEAEERGAGEILLTSMDRDGTGEGYDLELTRRVRQAVRIPVIASGGVGTLDHMREAIQEADADAVLAASIFHFRTHQVSEAKAYLQECGIPVRRVHDAVS